MSTPAISGYVRHLNKDNESACVGAILLTASHNPGGENEDFGIKFNSKNGGPALESLTNRIYEESKKITQIKIAKIQDIDLSTIGSTAVKQENKLSFKVNVVDTCQLYVEQMKTLFDFDALKKLAQRNDFSILFDGMHGAAGPYATKILGEILGVPESNLKRCNILPDFGGGHPDPNLTYAADLVA